MVGTVKKSMARLQPTIDMMYPNTIEPIKLPILLSDPIHEDCSLVSGPDTRGVFTDISFGSAGLTY